MIVRLRALLLRWTLPRCEVCGGIKADRSAPWCSPACETEIAMRQATAF